MADAGVTIINNSRSENFCYVTEKGITLNIHGEFKIQAMSEMLAVFGGYIDMLPFCKPFEKTESYKQVMHLSNPYDLPQDFPSVIDVHICSGGGNNVALEALSAELNRAKAKGAIVRTYVMGRASSCASLLAIQGTPEFRIMDEWATHFIHFGEVRPCVKQFNEIEVADKRLQRHMDYTVKKYLTHTKLDKKTLRGYLNTEGKGDLVATECLNNGLCDWIQTPLGYIKKNVKTR